jgi:hypothetical protein
VGVYEKAAEEYELALQQAEYQEKCLKLAQERLYKASQALARAEQKPGIPLGASL